MPYWFSVVTQPLFNGAHRVNQQTKQISLPSALMAVFTSFLASHFALSPAPPLIPSKRMIVAQPYGDFNLDPRTQIRAVSQSIYQALQKLNDQPSGNSRSGRFLDCRRATHLEARDGTMVVMWTPLPRSVRSCLIYVDDFAAQRYKVVVEGNLSEGYGFTSKGEYRSENGLPMSLEDQEIGKKKALIFDYLNHVYRAMKLKTGMFTVGSAFFVDCKRFTSVKNFRGIPVSSWDAAPPFVAACEVDRLANGQMKVSLRCPFEVGGGIYSK